MINVKLECLEHKMSGFNMLIAAQIIRLLDIKIAQLSLYFKTWLGHEI